MGTAAIILGILGLLGSIAGTWISNTQNQQINQQQQKHNIQVLQSQQQFAREEAEAADQRTRNLYYDLQSPEAIRKQLEQAGLSVGMMYGQGGLGGHMSSGAQAATPASMNTTPIGMQSLLGLNSMAPIQDAMTQDALRQKTLAEAAEIRSRIPKNEQQVLEIQENINKMRAETQTELARLQQVIADTNVKNATEAEIKARTAYQETLNKIANIDLTTKDAINHATLEEIEANIQKLHQESAKLGLDMEIVEKTKDSVIRKVLYESLSAMYNYTDIQPAQKRIMQETMYKLSQEGLSAFYDAKTQEDLYNCLNEMGTNKGEAKILIEILKTLARTK